MGGSVKTPLSLSLVLALAALLAGQPVQPAVAQTASGGAEAPAEGDTRVQSYTMDLRAVRLDSLLGREVRTRDEDPGRIIDILADGDGQVRAAVVELGGFLGIGTRKVAVDWSALRFEVRDKRQSVILDMTRDQLRLAPEYRPSEPVFVRQVDDW
jgi:hypothetical protein